MADLVTAPTADTHKIKKPRIPSGRGFISGNANMLKDAEVLVKAFKNSKCMEPTDNGGKMECIDEQGGEYAQDYAGGAD